VCVALSKKEESYTCTHPAVDCPLNTPAMYTAVSSNCQPTIPFPKRGCVDARAKRCV
jgi:hypothetical protein